MKNKAKKRKICFLLYNNYVILFICENLFIFSKLIKKGESVTEQLVDIERMENAVALFGSFDENIKEIEKAYGVGILCRGTQIKISGDPEKVSLAGKAVQSLLSLISRGEELNDQNIHYVMDLVNEGNEEQVNKISSDVICITSKGKPVKAKTLGQKAYIEAIKNTTVTIGVGPAGTGKTYLAVAMAVKAFRRDGLYLGDLTQAGNAVGILLAHPFQQLITGIGTLVVALGFDGPDQVLLFRSHEIIPECAVFQHGVQQKLLQKGHHGDKDRIPFQSKAVINETAGKTGAVNVTDAAHQCAYRGAVQVIQPQGDGAHIRTGFGAPQ